MVLISGCCSEPTSKAGDRNVPVSHSCSQGLKPQQSYMGSTQPAGQVRGWGGKKLRQENWALLTLRVRLTWQPSAPYFPLFMFFYLLSTSHLSKRPDKQCMRSFDEAGKKITERISPTSLYHCDFFIQLPAPTDNRP